MGRSLPRAMKWTIASVLVLGSLVGAVVYYASTTVTTYPLSTPAEVDSALARCENAAEIEELFFRIPFDHMHQYLIESLDPVEVVGGTRTLDLLRGIYTDESSNIRRKVNVYAREVIAARYVEIGGAGACEQVARMLAELAVEDTWRPIDLQLAALLLCDAPEQWCPLVEELLEGRVGDHKWGTAQCFQYLRSLGCCSKSELAVRALRSQWKDEVLVAAAAYLAQCGDGGLDLLRAEFQDRKDPNLAVALLVVGEASDQSVAVDFAKRWRSDVEARRSESVRNSAAYLYLCAHRLGRLDQEDALFWLSGFAKTDRWLLSDLDEIHAVFPVPPGSDPPSRVLSRP